MNCLIVAILALGTASSTKSAPSEPAEAAAETRPAATVHLMSAKSEDRLRKMLPKVADADLQKILDDPRLILYTDHEMPRAYQMWSGDLQGVHSPYYNISANGSEPYGNGNREFPWGARPERIARKMSRPSASSGCRAMKTANQCRWSGTVSG